MNGGAAIELHQRVAAVLAGQGHRYTPARELIVAALDGLAAPPTAAQVASILGQPLSSVYRNLNLLSSLGVLARVVGLDRQERFELVGPEDSPHHHHHLVCSICGLIEAYPVSDELERAIRDLVDGLSTGFRVFDHSLDLVGTCADCGREPVRVTR